MINNSINVLFARDIIILECCCLEYGLFEWFICFFRFPRFRMNFLGKFCGKCGIRYKYSFGRIGNFGMFAIAQSGFGTCRWMIW